VFSQGALAYTPAEKTKTNRSGEYRLGRLRAGRRYLVLAKKVLRTHPAADPAARDTVLLPTYFPGTPRVEQSEPVIVSPSENRSGVDIRLASGPWFCIEGEVSAPMPSLQIFENMPLTQGWKFEPVTVKPDSEGRFAACGFHSGEYRLSAAAGSAGRDMIAAYAEAEITTHDLRGLRVPVRTPVTIAGETAWDPTPVTEVAANLNISLTTSSVRSNYADGDVPSSGYVFGMNSVSKIAVPGEFNLGSWPADDYTLSVSGIPAGCYLKDALWGTTSVLHRPLRIERGFGGDVRLRIVLACDAGSITAHVTDHDGAPVSNGNLYLFPSTADTPAAMQEMLRRARVQKGWSEFRRIPPGRYFALACDLELDGTAEPILKLWDARWRGKEFEVSGNATVQITLERMRVE